MIKDTFHMTQIKIPEKENNIPRRQIIFSPPDISEAEIAQVAEVLRSGWITTGPKTKKLEQRLAAYIMTGNNTVDVDTPDAERIYTNRLIALSSATAAEELNLRLLGIGPGDEVIVPAYTYTATAAAVIHVGAKVVFVDVVSSDGSSVTNAPEMDYEAVGRAVNEHTKAVVAVDLGGIICDYDKLYQVVASRSHLFTPRADRSNGLGDLAFRIQQAMGRVAILADSAHSLGAWKYDAAGIKCYAGTIADFTSFSFHAVKNFTTAEGGASTWRKLSGISDEEICHYYKMLSLHGQSKDALAKTKAGAWEYDVLGPWYKCNMTDVMAAIGLRQLDRYPQMLKRRQEIIRIYDAACDRLGVTYLKHSGDGYQSSGHLYLARIPGICAKQRAEIIANLTERGVACNVHYKPLPMMTAYQKLGWRIEVFPNAYRYFENLITLPLHTLLSDEDAAYVMEQFEAAVKEYI